MSDRPRIAFLVRSLAYGGAQRQLIVLARGLRSAGWDVSVFVFYAGPLEDELRATGAEVVNLRKRSRWDVVLVLLRLVFALRRLRPGVLHSYMAPENVAGAFAKLLLPRMRLVWGIRATDFETSEYGPLYRMALRFEGALKRVPDLVIANSNAAGDWLRARAYGRSRIAVIHNGIDIERFRPAPELRAKLRAAWSLDDTALVIGTVARFDPMKGYELLIEAASLLVRERPDIRFVCVGDETRPEYFAQLQTLARTRGVADKIRWQKSYTAIEEVYNAFDVMTLTSIYGEGFSNAVGEAMACEVPCVVTESGDNAYLVDGAGFVVRAEAASVVDGWRAALAANRSEMGRLARQRIIEEFSVARLVSTTDDALRGTRTA
jgi:glycosyltransferase involved in cell wall biosynthesis